ncbi:MAG: Glu/Leu/Phe/Val dehydrogenase [Nitrospirales bacterium]|nr:Glu/Leu/Phe/Val dehydrogenase [Nitrospirales bacterium]
MSKTERFEITEIGPSKVIELFFPVSRFRAFVVVDNTALGPSIGGVRVSAHVTVDEVRRLARAMTLKNSIAGLSHGGGKAGIVADPLSPDKEHIFRTFAQAIKDIHDYIPGPDMGSNEECMAWVQDEIGRSVGLPEEVGGLPLDRLGATGYGLAECAEVACPSVGMDLKGSRVSIQGLGSVGKAAARFLSRKGAVIVAAGDTKGSIHNPDGLDVEALIRTKEEQGSVIHYAAGSRSEAEAVFSADCDILIPAATPDVIHRENVGSVKARLILQGANIPVTAEAEESLHRRGVLVVPDFIANAGGVIMAAMEYAKRTEAEAFQAIAERIRKNTGRIIERSVAEGILPRQAAETIALERVKKAMTFRKGF